MSGRPTRLLGVAVSIWVIGVFIAVGGIATAGAHAGHEHPTPGAAPEGWIPGIGDLRKVGDTTYRFLPGKGEYEVRQPGKPVAFTHGDPTPALARDEGVPAIASETSLPASELAPICRTEGRRIAVMYTHYSSETSPTPVAQLRSIVKRMNWKVADQSSQSSAGSRIVRMAVDCNAQGEINVYDVPVSGRDFPEISNAVEKVKVGNETLKYLVFDTRPAILYAGQGHLYPDNRKSRTNSNAGPGGTAVIWSPYWETLTPVHEMFHTLGATQGTGIPKAPYSNEGGHCIDGLDIMCYADATHSDWGTYSATRCPASAGYNTPTGVPLDCGNDTYFDAGPNAGTYLAEYWNIAQSENPYLAIQPAQLPNVTTLSATVKRSQSPMIGGRYAVNGDYSAYWWEWGTSPSMEFKSSTMIGGWGYGWNEVNFTIPDTDWGQTYYYRLTVRNDLGTRYGDTRTFAMSLPPSATTGESAELTTASAKLLGTVDAEGISTGFQFEYGPTTSYGTTVPVEPQNAGFSYEPVGVSFTVSGLMPATVYHYRIRATSPDGTAVGADKTFMTLDTPPLFGSNLGSSGTGPGQFDRPSGLAVDGSGNLWVADSQNNRIDKFNSKGEFVKQVGSSGNENGQFNWPIDVAVDSTGNVYVAEAGNSRVQKFDPEGKFLLKFGSYGSAAGQLIQPAGLAVDSSGRTWVSDRATGRVLRFSATGTYLGAIESGFNGPELKSPTGVAIDPEGNVWVADVDRDKLVEYTAYMNYKSQFGTSGSGPGEVDSPQVLDFTPDGRLWVGNHWSGRIQEFSQAGQYLTQFGGGHFVEPDGIAVNGDGSLYVANSDLDRVEKWGQQAPKVVTGEPKWITSTQAELGGSVDPRGLPSSYYFEYGPTIAYGSKVPMEATSVGSGSGAVPVAELAVQLQPGTPYHCRIVAVSEGGISYGDDRVFETARPTKVLASTIGSSGANNGQLDDPQGVDIDPVSENVWVADAANHRVERFKQNGEFVGKFGSFGTGSGKLNRPVDVATTGEQLWVTDSLNGTVQKFKTDGTLTASTSGTQLIEPVGVDLTDQGYLWVSDAGAKAVKKFTGAGVYQFSTTGGPALVKPTDILINSGGLWVVDTGADRILRYSYLSGEYITQFGSSGSGPGQFQEPVSISKTGEETLLIGERSGRVQEVTESGKFVGQFGGGQLNGASGIAGQYGGFAYVSNSPADRVEKWIVAAPPIATMLSASSVGSRTATLRASVNPNAIATTYRFEYGTTTAYGSRVPVPEKSIGADATTHEATEAISGLQPGTTYHFRVVASNAQGVTRAEDETFTTAVKKPLVITQTAINVKPESATLRASVNPEGFATDYHFEYGKTTAYGTSVPVSAEGLGAGTAAIQVSQAISGLTPNSTYHFRVVATSIEGTSLGEDVTFTTDYAGQIAGMPVTQPFNGTKASQEAYAASWATLAWAASKGAENGVYGWAPTSPAPSSSGAFYNSSFTDAGTGVAVVAKTGGTPEASGRGFSLWSEMPTPTGTRAGYELRFTYISSNNYEVTLNKWQGGVRTIMASQASTAFPAGSSVALVDQGTKVSGWTDTGAGFGQRLSVEDSVFSSGKTGIEGSATFIRLKEFRVGSP